MIREKQYDNGFTYLELTNSSARARIALQGAHLFHYRRNDAEPLLWLSRASLFEQGRAIRGGVPVCWPWFGKHPDNPELPQHGFARTALWQLKNVDESDPARSVVTLEMRDSDQTRELWPQSFSLELRISIGPTLAMELTTRNVDSRDFTITSALHTYFRVSDISGVEVRGLIGRKYYDNLDGRWKTQHGELHIDREVDRVFQDVDNPIELHDRKRKILIQPRGSRSAVVWNPWIEKCARMADMEPDSYKTMLCIETANALADAQTLAPGQEHTLAVEISG